MKKRIRKNCEIRHTALVGCILGLVSGCSGSDGSASTPPLTVAISSTTYATAGSPFSVVVSSAGSVFVSITADGTAASVTGLQVFGPSAGGLAPVCVNALPASLLGDDTYGADLSFFPGQSDIAAGIGYPGAVFSHVADLLTCNATGYVVDQNSTTTNAADTLGVAVTPDGKFAFVANEDGVAPGATTTGNIGVVAIQRDANGDFTTGTALIGQISTGGNSIAGLTMSPDGTRLYVTSEIAASGTAASGGDNPILTRTSCVRTTGSGGTVNGLLTVIDVAAAETNPSSNAIIATVAAGCSPVRMAETKDQSTLWVAVRGDNRVLAFSTATLESNPDTALLGYADSGGAAPVGIRLFHNEQLLAVANSNRFDTGVANMSILNVASPASPYVVQTAPTGLFPREIDVGPDDATLYLTNYNSETLQVIRTLVSGTAAD